MPEGDTFIKFIRSKVTDKLLRNPREFLLLALIARRAKRTNSFSPQGLKVGEALIGDHRACGLTERQYRTAKANLEKWKFSTFKPTTKGTIAKLINSEVFDINSEKGDEQNDERPTNDRRLTRKERRVKNKTKDPAGPVFKNENPNPHHYSAKVGSLIEAIDSKCETILSLPKSNDAKDRFRPNQFVQRWANQNGHPKAIDEALADLISRWDEVTEPWAYGNTIMRTKSQHYHEKEHMEQAAEFKNVVCSPEIRELAKNLFCRRK